METNRASTPDMTNATTANTNQNNKHHVHQPMLKNSFIRMFYAKLEWSDTLELIGCIFLLLISYFIGCELTEYSSWRASNIPNDAILYRYQWVAWVMMSLAGTIIIAVTLFAVQIVINIIGKSIFLAGVKRFYIPEKQSYKWWQTKRFIYFIISVIIMLIYIVIAIELSRIMLIGFDFEKPFQDRLFFHRLSGILFLILCPIVFLCYMLLIRKTIR